MSMQVENDGDMNFFFGHNGKWIGHKQRIISHNHKRPIYLLHYSLLFKDE